jgi:hypothetical protein
MSGPTQAQTNLQNEQAQFYQQATQNANTTFGEDQQLLQQLQSIYDPILAKGPNQEGFSQDELNDLNAQATEGTAENYQGAAKAVNENLAAEGGGNISLPDGGADQLKEEVAAASAQQQSAEENQIKQADYAQGYNEFQTATGALEDVSGQLNPIGYSGAATGAGSAEGVTANQIAQENNSWLNATLGAAGAVGGAFAGSDAGSTAIAGLFGG